MPTKDDQQTMATLNGTSAANTLTGTAAADLIYGRDGADSLSGLAGADKIYGGNHGDKIWGGDGNDSLYGDSGNDFIYAGNGNDTAYGGIGDDTIHGDGGTDRLFGEAGNDTLKGGLGISHLDGGSGNDKFFYNPTSSGITSVGNYLEPTTLKGGTGYDTLTIENTASSGAYPSRTFVYVNDDGTASIDFQKGGPEEGANAPAGTFSGIESLVLKGKGGAIVVADTYGGSPSRITGTEAADAIYGGFGNETLIGGGGNDTLHAGGGYDTLTGGAGNDRFVFDLEATGNTVITDFQGAGVKGGDVLLIDSYLLTDPATQISYADGKTVFQLTGDMSITVLGTTPLSEPHGTDWLFA